MSAKSVIYCFSKPLTPTTTEQLDIALTSAVFDQKVGLVFLDDGVMLLPEIDATRDSTDFAKSIAALRMMDDIALLAEDESLRARKIDVSRLPEFVQVETTEAITDVIRTADLAIYF